MVVVKTRREREGRKRAKGKETDPHDHGIEDHHHSLLSQSARRRLVFSLGAVWTEDLRTKARSAREAELIEGIPGSDGSAKCARKTSCAPRFSARGCARASLTKISGCVAGESRGGWCREWGAGVQVAGMGGMSVSLASA